jgi:Fe-S-cluster containining protein
MAFACTGCGDCCRGFAREATTWEPEDGPMLRLSDEPGLPLMSWEWQRFRALAASRGLVLDTQPFDAVLDEAERRAIVLSYRMGGDECAFFEPREDMQPGPRSVAWGRPRGGVCSIYEHRPLACRAYPLVPMRGGIALSLHCPELVDADPGDERALAQAYGGCIDDARAFRAAPALAVRVLEQLERAGHVRLARDARAVVGAREWPRVDLCELASAHGLGTWQAYEARARAEPPKPS